MSGALRVSPSEAIATIVFALTYAGGELPLFVNGEPAPALRAPGIAERLVKRARDLDMRQNAEVAVGLPQGRASTVLWAWVRGTEQLKWAKRFKPMPSIVLRMGPSSERLLLWSMAEAVPYGLVEQSNARLCYALHAPKTRTRVDQLRVPLPGTFLRRGREKPRAVLVTRLELGEHTRSSLVGRLREPPPPDAWRTR